MLRKLLYISLLIISLTIRVKAQEQRAPLILLLDGDFWAWDEGSDTLHQLTEGGYKTDASLSPDGKHLVYKVLDEKVIEDINENWGINYLDWWEFYDPPQNIHMLDVMTGKDVLIAGQPPNAAFDTSDHVQNFVMRSRPAWSPDGTQLAWTEVTYLDTLPKLLTYNLNTGLTKTVLNNLPYQGGIAVPVRPAELWWGKLGVVIYSSVFDPLGSTKSLFVCDVDRSLSIEIPLLNEAEYLSNFMLVTVGGQEHIALQWYDHWESGDLLTRQWQPLPGTLELSSLNSPDTSLTFRAVEMQRSDYQFQLFDTHNQPVGEKDRMAFTSYFDYAIQGGAISPDGQSAAYWSTAQNAVIIWPSGAVVPIPPRVIVSYDGTHEYPPNPPQALFWGPTVWRIHSGS